MLRIIFFLPSCIPYSTIPESMQGPAGGLSARRAINRSGDSNCKTLSPE